MHLQNYYLTYFLATFTAAMMMRACSPGEPSSISSHHTWEVYRGTPEANQYSSLAQVNVDNIDQLEVAWEYHTGGNTEKSTIECNPIIIGDIMYITSPDLRVIALDATTGKELWQFNPDHQNIMGGVNRGVTYWHKGKDERILFTARHWLFALHALTGAPIPSFGQDGKVDLREGLSMDPQQVTISVTSPGIVYKDIIILGSAVGEGYQSTPGYIRAYHIKTGELAWTFRTIPKEGELGYEKWENVPGGRFGGANAWGGLSLDQERGWVFASTGSIAFDFFGGKRKGTNLFANCILALDANSGERQWHYQTIHHDIWDYDLPCAPNLVSLKVDGEWIDAVVQPTKMGYLFLLDRETGKPLYPVEETPFPQSDIPGESSWPTQPIPSFPEPYVTSEISEQTLTHISPKAHTYALEQYTNMRTEGLFTPPSLQGSLMMPGTRGGAEWSGASFDPETHILYINANEIANVLKLKAVPLTPTPPTQQAVNGVPASSVASGELLYVSNCANCHGAEKQGAIPTYPALLQLPKRYQKEEVSHIITHGKGSMPAFPQFSSEELGALWEFLADSSQTVESSIEGLSHTRFVIDGYKQFLDEEGYPATQPPWGSLNAIDLHTGKLIWKVPLGEYRELTDRGIPPTGTQNMGGCVVTAGRLVFIGASQEETFKAYDKHDGALLWSYPLPAGGYATPSVYEVNGRQFIVIAAGGGGKNGTKSGDSYIAFTLKE